MQRTVARHDTTHAHMTRTRTHDTTRTHVEE
jgi:hypothetical protein